MLAGAWQSLGITLVIVFEHSCGRREEVDWYRTIGHLTLADCVVCVGKSRIPILGWFVGGATRQKLPLVPWRCGT